MENIKLPKEINVQILNSTFENVSEEILVTLKSRNLKLVPAFIFIDPFGYNLPFELIQRLMEHEKCEVFINFMYEFINRFIRRAGQEQVKIRLFGTEEWHNLNLDVHMALERKKPCGKLIQEGVILSPMQPILIK